MKNKYYKLVLASAVLIAVQTVSLKAQTPLPCGTDEAMRKLYAEHPELIQQQIAFDNAMKPIIEAKRHSRTVEAVHIVPVVFHVIYADPTGTDNIPDAQIYDEMKILNRDYAKMNADTSYIVKNSPFDTLASDIHFEFRLATIDPNGNCTNGIDRIQSHLGTQATDAAKLNQWPRNQYLNIWSVISIGAPGSTAAAYALYPSAVVNYPQGDGVLSMSTYIGSIGPNTSLGTSRTITHEIGHCMNLEHVWGNNNNAGVACGDDGVDDTPITKGHLYDCTPTPHCTRSFANHIVYNFNGLHLSQGQADPTTTTDTTAVLGHFTANNVSANTTDTARFSFAKWPAGIITDTVTTISIDSNGKGGYNIGDRFKPNGGAGTFALCTVTHTQVVDTPRVVSGGTGGTPGRTTFTGTTGTGTKFTCIGTINGAGNLTGALTLVNAGNYTVNPTSISSEPITGGGLTGATVSIAMGVQTVTFTGGIYTVDPPSLTGSSTTNITGSGTGLKINLVMGYKSNSGTIDPTKYYEVTVGPDAYHNMTLDGISFNVKRNSTGIRTFAVRSSVDGFTNNLKDTILPANSNLQQIANHTFLIKSGYQLAIQTGCHIILPSTFNYTIPPSQNITFRIYGWNAVDSTGTFSIGNVNFDTKNPNPDTIVYNFSGVYPPTGFGTTDPTNLQIDTAATIGQFHASGVSARPVESENFSYTNWALGGVNDSASYSAMTGAIDTTKYYEVSIGAKYANDISITGISFDVKRNSTGVRSFAVRSSVSNFTSNLTASITPTNAQLSIKGTNEFFFNNDTNLFQSGSHIALSGTSYTNFYNPIKFRFYGWNAEDSLGSFTLDNVSFTDTAGLIENFDNYMDYSYCSPWGQRMFTRGQKDRMRAALESSISYRDNLFITSNLIATGTQTPYPPVSTCPPKPDFSSNRKEVCVGGTVTFYRNIMNVTHNPAVSSFTKKWVFDGGGPGGSALTVTINDTLINYNAAASSLIAQNVTYTVAGDYAVKLVVSNSAGTDSIIKTSYIHVDPGWHQYSSNQTETFENPSSSYSNWIIDNYDNNPHTWGLINFAGYSGTHSMVMNGFGNYFLDLDDFITPGFNLTYLTGGAITFQCAGASSALTTADLNDKLQIWVSKDCGQSWQSLTTLSGASLCNNGYSATSFIPTSQSQWSLHSVNIPSSYYVGNTKFKFAYTSGNASNNIYIDDINVTGVLGINENSLDNSSFSVYPNPSNDATNVYYHLNTKGNVKIEVLDVLGKKIMEIDNNNQSEGDYNYSISKQDHNLKNGIYFVKFSFDNNSVTKKIIFTE